MEYENNYASKGVAGAGLGLGIAGTALGVLNGGLGNILGGIVKIVTDADHGTILGVHMIGSYASEIIYGAAIMVAEERRYKDVQKIVFPHPTVCEVIREGMFMIK